MPAGDADVFDEQPEQLLLLQVVEPVDHPANLGREVVHPATEQVPAGQCGAFVGQVGAFVLELAVPGIDLAGAPVQLGELDQPGLVEVDESSAFGTGGVELAV